MARPGLTRAAAATGDRPAIALDPRLLVCDEAVSAFDVSTRNQIRNLLEDLQAEFGPSYLFIAHDLAVFRRVAHRVAVMYLGGRWPVCGSPRRCDLLGGGRPVSPGGRRSV
ncbi:hypothetical protein ACL02T_30825 [Pseudonocardia sp. RS010]|uniref:hypothetical protein n=1 Tax=Pseudonocardia sp. RS010 TaxID=3385979 RepID=UPI0039A1CBDC